MRSVIFGFWRQHILSVVWHTLRASLSWQPRPMLHSAQPIGQRRLSTQMILWQTQQRRQRKRRRRRQIPHRRMLRISARPLQATRRHSIATLPMAILSLLRLRLWRRIPSDLKMLSQLPRNLTLR